MDVLDVNRPKIARKQMLSFLIEQLSASENDELYFVQVGGNDGQLGDPITNFIQSKSWAGTIFEPVPYYFEKLSKHYEDYPSVNCLNQACSSEEGAMEIYYLDPNVSDEFPAWIQGCATTNKERMIEHVKKFRTLSDEQASEFITSVNVEVVSLNEALKARGVSQVDLLVVDVEGHEIEVIDGFDIENMPPKMAIIENNGQDLSREAEVIAPWNSYGYDVVRIGDDLIAIKENSRWVSALDVANMVGRSFPNIKIEAR